MIARQSKLALGLILAGVFVFSVPAFSAEKNNRKAEHWGNWSAMGSGYVARRRQPPKLEEPAARRQLASAAASNENSSSSNSSESQQRSLYVESSQSVSSVGVASVLPAATKVSALWLRTQSPGLYSVSVDRLASELGVSAAKVRNKSLSGALYLTRGKKATSTNANFPVSWYYDELGDAVVFAAGSHNTFYSDENAFRLKLGRADSKRAQPMDVVTGEPDENSVGSAAFRDSLAFEEEPDMMFLTWVVAAEPDADYWFWDYLYAGSRDLLEIPLDIPNPDSAGIAQLRVTLRGFTDLEVGDEHRVFAQLNGQPIGSVTWDGMTQAVLVADFDQSLLAADGQNTLSLTNAYDAGTVSGQFLDDIRVDYNRLPIARNNTLWLHSPVAGLQTVSGFSSENVLLIESPEGEASKREDFIVGDDGAGGWAVSFDAQGGADYLLMEASTVEAPIIVADISSNLKNANNRADYLIVASRAFAGTAQRLAEYRAARYSDVQIAWVDDIYDEFSAGRRDPAAVGRFMRKVVKAWDIAPEMVTLLGKGSLDEKNRMGYGDSYVPVVLTSNPWSLAASDSRLLGFEDDAPYAIGRIPITSDAEGLAYIDKLEAYESAQPEAVQYEALLIADNPDEGGNFHRNSDIQAAYLLDNLGFSDVGTLYHPIDVVGETLLLPQSWEKGYVSYDGHGSTAQIGDARENFLLAADAAQLQNTQLPIFAALTCAVGDDTMPGVRSLSGALVLNPDGGAIAALAPSGLSLDAQAQVLGKAFTENLFLGGEPLGKAIQNAKWQTGNTIQSFMPRMYGIVGEPAVYARP